MQSTRMCQKWPSRRKRMRRGNWPTSRTSCPRNQSRRKSRRRGTCTVYLRDRMMGRRKRRKRKAQSLSAGKARNRQ